MLLSTKNSLFPPRSPKGLIPTAFSVHLRFSTFPIVLVVFGSSDLFSNIFCYLGHFWPFWPFWPVWPFWLFEPFLQFSSIFIYFHPFSSISIHFQPFFTMFGHFCLRLIKISVFWLARGVFFKPGLKNWWIPTIYGPTEPKSGFMAQSLSKTYTRTRLIECVCFILCTQKTMKNNENW